MSSKDLSIDEILKEAEEVLNKIERKSKETIEEIKNVDEPIDLDEDVKTFTPESAKQSGVNDKTVIVPDIKQKNDFDSNSTVSDKTAVAPKIVEPGEKTAVVSKVSDKTAVAPKISDKTTVVPKVDRSKKRFFKSNSADDEYGTQPPKIIEKAATIKSKSRFDKTSDLQEIPTILAVEELEKTRIMLGGEPSKSAGDEAADENDYDSSAQIKMSGFDDGVDEVPEIDEEVAEKLLKQRREEKVNKFRLFATEEVEADKKSEAKRIFKGDYKNENEKAEALAKLVKKRKSLRIKSAVSIVLGILLLLLTIGQDSPYLPGFLSSSFVYYTAVIIIYGIIIGVNINNVIQGFNFRHGLKSDFPVAVSALLALGHTFALMFIPDLELDGGALFPSAAAFALILSTLGKCIMMTRVIENFEFLTDGKDKYTVEEIVNEVDAAIISRNLLVGEPLLKFSVKTDFPTSFMEISFADEPADKTAKILAPLMLGLNLVLFVVLGVLQKDWYYAFNVLTAGIIISCPVISLFATNAALCGVSRAVEKNGAMVCGYEGAHVTHNSNALVMEASDLFGARSCDLHGIKTFNGTKIDDAILQTAAVIIKTKSPLANVFDDVIVGKQSILPDAEGIIYEDKMGTSAWIYQKKILVGTRDLLIRHGVAVPKEEFEHKYTRKGRKALYLAVAGKIAAMFVVSYSADNAVKKSLKKLEKSGITILLKSCDPYINEESIMEIFDLPEGFIRVMASSNARIFEKYSQTVVEKSPAYTVHNGTALGFISGVRGCETLVAVESLLSVLISFGSAIGFGVVALLGFMNGMSQINALNIVVFQAVWSIFVLIISKIRRSGL